MNVRLSLERRGETGSRCRGASRHPTRAFRFRLSHRPESPNDRSAVGGSHLFLGETKCLS